MMYVLKENPLIFLIIVLAWLPAIVITLLHLFKRKDLTTTNKIVWIVIGLIPIAGLLFYGIVNYKNKKAIVWLTVLASIITAITIWYYIFYQPTALRRDVNKEASIGIAAQTLIKEYQENEEVANAKYSNKVVEINGVVEKIEEDETGQVVYLHTGIEGTSVSGRLKSKQTVAEKSSVVMKGILTGYILGQIQLNEAVITKGASENTTTIPPKQDTATVLAPAEKKDSIILKEKKFQSTKGQIKFLSVTASEEIEAINTQVISSISEKGKVHFAALIKGFRFENELMQKTFNSDKYMHSDKFSKSEFDGNIINIQSVNFNKNNSYQVTAEGNLTLHGITKKIKAEGILQVENGILTLNSKFKIKIKEFGVDDSEVAEQIEIIVQCSYK
ncbi:MAG: YceI family protein [Chitinophagales bacterium]|nr:YceI family protein [Chitinophagales bacterium]